MYINPQQGIVPNELLKQWHDAKLSLDKAKAQFNKINKDLQKETDGIFQHVLQQAGKEYGQSTLAIGDFKVTGGIKEVSTWDQKGLLAIAKTLSPEQYQAVFNMKLDVPKSKFNQLNDADLRTRLEAARTVEFKPMTPKIEPLPQEAE
tara:strand:+ start:145121 stop:145564 length:444 start_codon:yes stop_codon:yes gene_type:complete